MKATVIPLLLAAGAGLIVAGLFVPAPPVGANPKPHTYWQVEDLRAGMKGVGRTVMKGTKIETFQAEVIGVLKNTSPGRDMVLCRLSGLNLDKTGVIQGMSGSPIYINNKLVGAVAYAWAFGKEPIAGITPFCQMHKYVESYERRDLVEQNQPQRIGLKAPMKIGGQHFDAVTVSNDFDEPQPTAADGLWMMPLRTPLAASNFSPNVLKLLREQFRGSGLVPLQGGGVGGQVAKEEAEVKLEPGSALSVALVLGDFDVSGIGTVTHVEGKRVYGFGHPFYGLGACEFPLMTGYTHTIYPRQNLSFKIGSPLKTVGIINADVSTCIAGWLDRKPDMLPIKMTVRREQNQQAKTFNVRVVRQRSMIAPLVFAVLTNSVDMEGELPEELTADLQARIEVEGHAPVVIHDKFSGSSFSGSRAPVSLYSQVSSVVGLLTYNTYHPVRIKRIECTTQIRAGRSTAEIEAVELDSETYEPGETVKGTVFVRPFKGLRQRLPVTLKLPVDLPEGEYTATVCDDVTCARAELRDNPNLSSPQSLEQVFQALNVQTSAKRTNVTVRVPINAVGVALNGKSLPNLPSSMVQILGNTRRTGAQPMGGALVSRQPTNWVVQGSESVRFTVSKNKRVVSE